jgi:hypothetical protein
MRVFRWRDTLVGPRAELLQRSQRTTPPQARTKKYVYRCAKRDEAKTPGK